MIPLGRYEFYFDVYQRGQYTFKIRELHSRYGPIVRINPCELHVETPSFYDEVYAGGGKRRNKWEWFTNQFGIPVSDVADTQQAGAQETACTLWPLF
jgi:hypothetical protein